MVLCVKKKGERIFSIHRYWQTWVQSILWSYQITLHSVIDQNDDQFNAIKDGYSMLHRSRAE